MPTVTVVVPALGITAVGTGPPATTSNAPSAGTGVFGTVRPGMAMSSPVPALSSRTPASAEPSTVAAPTSARPCVAVGGTVTVAEKPVVLSSPPTVVGVSMVARTRVDITWLPISGNGQVKLRVLSTCTGAAVPVPTAVSSPATTSPAVTPAASVVFNLTGVFLPRNSPEICRPAEVNERSGKRARLSGKTGEIR
ncbi:hypothetical protein EKG83_36585 [Saccharothrix syringae]|uniref:Uncharacterized protein n=1 Tax=Saccharothrix syringae TaxID=103733 RepID=A0A5Q0H7L9_SACSY|nr:hypothetical protein EKG83_36585 [Saccharothrix syringae]